MKKLIFFPLLSASLLFFLFLSAPSFAAEVQPPTKSGPPSIRLRPKTAEGSSSEGLLAPDTDIIDAPTSAALDYESYAAKSRFDREGGLLQYVSFGVFQGVNLGASLAVDSLVGDTRTVRVRAPNAQVKWRFYDGDRWIPSVAVGYDGQGYDYDKVAKRYNERQRGFFIAASQELGLPGLTLHPSMNVSDFDTNAVYGSLPLSWNIEDRVLAMAEWDNINNFRDSRFNSGLRVYVTPHFQIDFDVRAIGQGGHFTNGDARGPERIVQLRYSNSF
jgi:hypothetical protein